MRKLSIKLRQMLSPYVYLSSNWLSLIGVIVVTTAIVLWIYLLPMMFRGEVGHPYVGILIFMGLPGLFFSGLILIPVGIIIRSRRERRKGIYPSAFPPLDFENRELRQLALFVVAATVINVLIGGQLIYSSVNYMDSVTFCGQTCHTVMQPEFAAYEHSPHARVACVECHIGPGASWFVRSKLSGVSQVFAVTFRTFDRPVPTPVRSLRPARETCEVCHWPARFGGNRLMVIPTYADDEANTLTETVLLLHVGGGNSNQGIHGAHVGPGVTIQYGSDLSRQKMHWVEYGNSATGKKMLYVDSETQPQSVTARTGRIMDCIDCHNRPTHVFHLPGEAMDGALSRGEIPPTLPFVKKQGVTLLQASYATQSEAARKIRAGLEDFYKQQYPQVFAPHRQEVEKAASAIVEIYNENVFPTMKVAWGTYPNNIGHMDSPGCFRCHGTLHAADDPNKMVPQDCDTCHSLLATGEANPKILTELGFASSNAQAQR